MRTTTGRLSLLLVPLLAAGCGAGEGKVAGRVLYDGAPLPGGRVTFRPADPQQNTVSAEVDRQGNYEIVLPAGEVRVCVDNRELEPPGAPITSQVPAGLPPEIRGKLLGAAKPDAAPPKPAEGAPVKPAGRYVKIPERYYIVETSGLQFTVQRGEQKHDITLTK